MSTGQQVERTITIGDGPVTVRVKPTRKGKVEQAEVKIVEFAFQDETLLTARIAEDGMSAEVQDVGKEGTTVGTITAEYAGPDGKTEDLMAEVQFAVQHGVPDGLEIDFEDAVPVPGPEPAPPEPAPAPEPAPPGPAPGPAPPPPPAPAPPGPAPVAGGETPPPLISRASRR